MQETPALKKQQNTLYKVLYAGLALAVITLFINPSIAFNNLISLSLLYCGIAYYNYCMLVFFVIFTLFNIVQFMMYLGIILQQFILTGKAGDAKTSTIILTVGFLLINIIYDVIACYYSYEAYKEFKHHTFSGMQSGEPLMGRNENRGGRDEEQGRGNNFTPFGGRGTPLN